MAVLLSPVGGVAAQFFDNNGKPLTGGKLFTYAAGSTTPAATFTSSLGNTAHTNPIILDGAGRVPGGEIWLTDGVVYKFVLQTSTNVQIATYDNIVGINSNFVNFTLSQEIQTATAGQTVFNLNTMQYQPGTNSLSVYVDGVNQYGPGAQFAYVETDATTVTFVSGLHVGASVKFTTAAQTTGNATDASVVSYNPPFTNAVGTNVEAKLAQYVSVEDFGAVGDGVTDDTAAIQNALSASLQVEFNGNYKISGSLTLRSGHSLRSTNKRSKIIRDTAVTPFDMIVGVSVTDIAIDNLWFDGVAKTTVTIASNRYCAIRLWDNGTAVQCERIVISNCRFDKTTSAENQSEGVRGVVMLEQCSDVEISNCQFYDNRATCVFWWNNTDNVRVSDCYCLGEQLPYDPTFQRLGSFTSGQADGVSVSNCRIKETGYTSINISGNGVSVSGCVIQSPNYAGITISESTPAATSVTITGCSVNSPGQDGIAIFLVDGLSITGCTFLGANTSGRAGVQVFNTTTGVIAKNITISGCQFNNNTSVGVGLRAGQNVNVTGNTFISNGTGFFSRNLSGAASSVYFVNNVVVDSANIAFELNIAATSAQTAYVANNTFISTDIATLQEYGVLSSGSNSTVILGQNSFSDNYDVASISFSFTAGKGLLALSSGVVQQLKIVSGFPLRSEWNQKHITMGTWEFWVDGTGDLRMKNGAPTSDTDGVVVGTQT